MFELKVGLVRDCSLVVRGEEEVVQKVGGISNHFLPLERY